MKLDENNLDRDSLAQINSLLDAGMLDHDLRDALAKTDLYDCRDESKLLSYFEAAVNEICREDKLDYKALDIIQAVISPRGDLTGWLNSNKCSFGDERLLRAGLYSTKDAFKRLASLTIECYERYVRFLGLSAKLMQSLADDIGDVKVRTLDNKLFYLDYPTGASLPFLFAEQSSLNEKGMVDGYEFCEDIYVWSIFGDDDSLLELVEYFAESTRELYKGNERLNFTLH